MTYQESINKAIKRANCKKHYSMYSPSAKSHITGYPIWVFDDKELASEYVIKKTNKYVVMLYNQSGNYKIPSEKEINAVDWQTCIRR